MKQIDTTVTQRGQVTLPAEVRRLLGVKPRDKVTFVIDDGEVRVTRPKYQSVDDVYGIFHVPGEGPVDWDEEIRRAKDGKADRDAKKLREQ